MKMRIGTLIKLLAALLPLLAGCSVQEPDPGPAIPAEPAGSVVPGEAILLLSEEAADSFDPGAGAALLESLGVSSIERIFPEAGEFEARHRAAGLHRWYQVRYDEAIPRTKAGGTLASLPGVEEVQFQRKMKPRSLFNDPGLAFQWYLGNDGSLGPVFKPGMDINVQPVWEKYTGGSRDVIVAVIDAGIQADHDDLRGVILPPEEGSRSFLNGVPPEQLHKSDHGTEMAGIIAAVSNNGLGVSGIAGGLNGQGGVRILSCEIFTSDYVDSGHSPDALVWAADHGAVIANNSWGGTFNTEEEAAISAEYFITHDSPLRAAIDYFTEHAGTDADGRQTGPMKGGLVLFASGNYGFAHDTPGEYSKVLAVGAFGPDGKMPDYSNYGPWVDILAPGGSETPVDNNEWIFAPLSSNNYGFDTGTSTACPMVAGVAALLVSYYGGEGFTVQDLKEALLGGAVPGVIDLQGRPVGGGKLDAAGAFAVLDEPAHPGPADIRFAMDYAGDWQLHSHEALDVTVTVIGNGKARLPIIFSTDCPGATAEIRSARQLCLHIDALQATPGSYTATIRVGSLATKVIAFTIQPNHAPQLTAPFDDLIINVASAAGSSLDLAEHFEDPDGEALSYLVSDEDLPLNYSLRGSVLTLTPDKTKDGGYDMGAIQIEAVDAHQERVAACFQVLLRDAYRDMDLYPNPVSTTLYVRPATDRNASVQLVNAVGAVQFSRESVRIGPFEPLSIDMSGLPGGAYALLVNGQRFTVTKR